MSAILSDDEFEAALERARAGRDEELAATAERVRSHEGDTIDGKTGVEVLQGVLRQRGWDDREGQIRMTQYVDEANLDEGGNSTNVGVVGVIAPVGTGKTLGYLAPALARGERVVIATSTKALQDQIVGEELPRLREDMLNAFGKNITFTVMKGKSNYVCLSHADSTVARYAAQIGEFADADATGTGSGDKELDALRSIAQRARLALAAGDVVNYDSDLALQALPPETQKMVNAKHACPTRRIDLKGQSLEALAESDHDVWRAAYCQSMKADIVVMNTALLVEEVIKQNSKVGPEQVSLLEGVGVVIIDEAHHAPNIVTSAFSASLSESEALKAAKEVDKRVEGGSAFVSAVKRFFDAVNDADENIRKKSAFHQTIAMLASAFTKEMASIPDSDKPTSGKGESALADFRDSVADVIRQIGEIAERKAIRGDKEVYSARVALEWSEDGLDFTLAAVPIDVSFFKSRLVSAITAVGEHSVLPARPEKTIVLCSGTMSASVPRLLGFGGQDVIRTVDTPFDPRRARVCTPKHLPLPNAPDWESKAFAAAEKAMKAIDGRTLFLCTSRRMVEAFAHRANDLPFAVHKQGDASRGELIHRFTKDENSILIATMGYWEGIDVPGPSLSLVIMDKVPFPVPSDAIIQARKEWVEAEGHNAFSIVDLGHASTMIAQGAGRLIRAEQDSGGVLILDSRIPNRQYGSKVLGQMDRRWLLYDTLDPFLGWLGTIRQAIETKNPDAVLDHPRDGQPLKPRSPHRRPEPAGRTR